MPRPTPMPADDGDATAPQDEVKRRFREALERKNARHHASSAAGETGDSKVHAAHGPASQQKSFRRKAGG